jgi:hypothetical protein
MLAKKISFVENNNYFGIDETIARKYINTLYDHIKYVVAAGKILGVPERQLNIHDDTKWTEAEFPGYALHFQGGGAPDEFSRAWLHHLHHNPHHWQYWIFSDKYTPENSNVQNGIVEMPYHFTLEMVADWMGDSKAYTGSWNMTRWLDKNLDLGYLDDSVIKLHSRTADDLYSILYQLGYRETDNSPKMALFNNNNDAEPEFAQGG